MVLEVRAIVVGSHPEQHWFGKLSKQLAGFGVEVVSHWPDLRSARSKSGLDSASAILVTKDCCSHGLMDLAKSVNVGLPILYISHRKAENAHLFAHHLN